MAWQPKILIVDDKPENIFALKTVLTSVDAQIIAAQNGNDALVEVLNHDFALAILDVQMPEIDGYELAEYIRSDAKNGLLPIIFLTAVFSDKHHIFRGYSVGAVDFITKPFEPEILLSKVNVLLEIYRQRQIIKDQNNYLNQTLQRLKAEQDALNQSAIVTTTDLNGVILEVNDRFCQISGYDRSEIIGKNHRIVRSDLHSAPFFGEMWKTILAGNTWRNEICNATKDGNLFWLDAVISPFLDENGKPYRFLSIAFEITERKQVEEQILQKNKEVSAAKNELKALNEILQQNNFELEEKVRQRTLDLRQRNAELKEINHELDFFIYRSSHDLRRPVTSMAGLIQLAGLDKENLEEYLSNLHETIQEMHLVLDKLQMVNTISQERHQLTHIDFLQIFSEIIDELSKRLDTKKIVFHFDIEPKEGFYSVYELLKIVLFNILENAIYFKDSEKGKQKINMVVLKRKKHISIKIQDNGIGIEDHIKEKIFDMFYRGSDISKGNGLGLYLVRKALQKLDGQVVVESQAGKFTTFEIILKYQSSITNLPN